MTVISDVGPEDGVSGTADKSILTGLLSVYPALLMALTLILNVDPVGDKDEMVYCLSDGLFETEEEST